MRRLPPPPAFLRRACAAAAVTLCIAPLASGCTVTTRSAPVGKGSHAVLSVVAAENTWGSIAAQLGGRQARVLSVISDPNADPHEYESSSTDARAFASANLVIVNGAGYDDWSAKLLSAQPAPGRKVLDIATLVGKRPGDNPHLWYDPAYVFRAIDAITAEYEAIEPAERSYFVARHAAVERAFAGFRQRLTSIAKRFAGARVASTESIFQYLAEYLHLDLVTPYSFMKAVSEGDDPPVSSIATFDHQITGGDFGVLVYNVQTVTPLTTTIRQQAAAKHIAVVAVSETIEPSNATFEVWMDGQLDTLERALAAKQPGS
jgi:zinc/manganese transport system substrate-binding protein